MTEYEKHLRAPIVKRIFKIEFLDENKNVTGEQSLDVLDGSMNIDLNTNARRGCSLTFDNSEEAYTPNEDSHIWIDRMFRLYTGIMVGNEERLFLRGTFVLGNPTIASDFSAKTASIVGMDKWHLLDGTLGGIMEDAVTILYGESIADAVQGVLDMAGDDTAPIIAYTDMTVPCHINKAPGDNYASILTELAEFLSWEVFYDEGGRLRFQPPQDFETEASVWDFSTNETTYKGGSHSYEVDKVKNSVLVIGDNINEHIVKGRAQDTNIFSPFNVYRWRVNSLVITDDLIHEDIYAQQRAEYELAKVIAMQESISVNAVPVDVINEGDIVTVEDGSADLHRDRCQVRGVTFPLRSDGFMTLDLWKTRKFY